MVKIFILFVILLNLCFCLKCPDFQNCYDCTSNKYMKSNCRWCNIDKKCHYPGAIFTNPCKPVENIINNDLCGCNKPLNNSDGVDAKKCDWYSKSHGDAVPPNTNDWWGGDFLPSNYISATTCACTGGGNVLWNTTISRCVRKQILLGHKNLSASDKRDFRQTTKEKKDPGEQLIMKIYKIHQDAFDTCGCPGSVAPFKAWEKIYNFSGSALMPCNLIPYVGELWWILKESRCGCEW